MLTTTQVGCLVGSRLAHLIAEIIEGVVEPDVKGHQLVIGFDALAKEPREDPPWHELQPGGDVEAGAEGPAEGVELALVVQQEDGLKGRAARVLVRAGRAGRTGRGTGGAIAAVGPVVLTLVRDAAVIGPRGRSRGPDPDLRVRHAARVLARTRPPLDVQARARLLAGADARWMFKVGREEPAFSVLLEDVAALSLGREVPGEFLLMDPSLDASDVTVGVVDENDGVVTSKQVAASGERAVIQAIADFCPSSAYCCLLRQRHFDESIR